MASSDPIRIKPANKGKLHRKLDVKLALALILIGLLSAQNIAPPPIPVRVYTVTSPVVFPSIPCSKALIFRNGVFQSPGVDYTVSLSAECRFLTGILGAGDQIEVATVP